MRPEGVAAARREMTRATRAIRRLTHADSLEDAEDAWVDFLNHANRIYLKLRAACHGQGVDWMWWKKKMDERRDDALLCYVHHARNTDTHRLDQTAASVGGQAQFLLKPLPVIDHGITYPVPTTHRRWELPDLDVQTIAWFAGGYLSGLVNEAALRLP